MDTLFERELAKRLAEVKQGKTDSFTQTVLTQDEYHRQMGYFQCLRDIEALCEEIRSDLRKG
jgi:hypothetical protein